jgi:hypothetical protein
MFMFMFIRCEAHHIRSLINYYLYLMSTLGHPESERLKAETEVFIDYSLRTVYTT